MSENRRYPWHYALFLMAYYVTNSVYQGFITVYYKGEGLTTAQIGMLSAAVPLVSVITQPFWGTLGDRMHSRNQLLRILAVCAFVVILAFKVSSSFWWLLPMVCMFSAFYTALQPMGDSIILEALQPDRLAFGPLRLTGCLSFALSSMLVGRFLEGRLSWVLYLTAILLCCVFAATYALPETGGHQKKGEKASMLEMFHLKNMTGLLTLITLLQLTMGYFYTFFPVYFTSIPGGNEALLGWCYLISATSEVPFLLTCDKLFDKIGVGRLMCISATVMTIRWIILGTVSSVPVVMASQVLHGWGFIVMTVSMSKYISLTVPNALKARGQMLLSIMGFGVARVAGNFGGGLIAGTIGIQTTFLLCAGITLVALMVFTPMYLRMRPLNGQEIG